MHGFIPLAREFIPRGRVPPVFVELSIGEAAVYRDKDQRLVLGNISTKSYRDNSANPLHIHSEDDKT